MVTNLGPVSSTGVYSGIVQYTRRKDITVALLDKNRGEEFILELPRRMFRRAHVRPIRPGVCFEVEVENYKDGAKVKRILPHKPPKITDEQIEYVDGIISQLRSVM